MVSLDELRKEKVREKHKLLEVKLIYDQPNFRLETFYFWLIDFLRDSLKLKVEKISDFYSASAGSFFFGEMGQRMAVLLNQGKSLAETINNIARSVISIINEYKLIENRLRLYDDIKYSDKDTALAAFKALKSLWIDNVDTEKGGASLRNLSTKLGYTTLLDIFFLYELGNKIEYLREKSIISDVLAQELKNRDIVELEKKNIVNQRVINIAKSRLEEFYTWLENSEKELRSRKDILKSYLKHQINAFVTYTEFARPYFRFARRLLIKEYETPDIVNVFETAMVELVLLATGDEQEIEEWDPVKEEKIKRKYIPLYEVSIKFRALPTVVYATERARMYSFIGRTDFEFRVYLVTKEELEEIRINEEIQDLLYIKGMTDDFLRSLSYAIFNVFLWDTIQSDVNLKEKIAKALGKSIDKIRRPEDIEWSDSIIEIIKKEKPQLLEGIEWIRKYLPKEEKKVEEKKEEKKEETIVSVAFPFISSFSDILYKIFKFIVTFGISELKIMKNLQKKDVERKSKEVLDKLKADSTDLGWKIYSSFKKTFRLLS